MSPHKRRKLHNKRTPWIRSRYSRKARAIQTLMRAQVLASGFSRINAIRFASGPTAKDKIAKSMAIAEARLASINAFNNVSLYGSKMQ